jgi:hypothetical protein
VGRSVERWPCPTEIARPAISEARHSSDSPPESSSTSKLRRDWRKRSNGFATDRSDAADSRKPFTQREIGTRPPPIG